MRRILFSALSILTAAVVIGMVTISIQQVYAPRMCPGCLQFKKLTHEYEKNVINAVINPNSNPGPRELLDTYNDKVVQLFFTDPWLDQVRTLFQSYTDDLTRIFDTQPPEPDKQLIQDFRSLTHDFEKAVIGLTQPPEPE